MKLNGHRWIQQNEPELIAQFGTARLVEHLNGRIELIGGDDNDRGEAGEWCSLFLDGAVDCGGGRHAAVMGAAY